MFKDIFKQKLNEGDLRMTQQEAIEAARKHNQVREKYNPRIEYVAMDENGLWYGYDEQPEVDEDFDEWKFSSWKVSLEQPEIDWKTTLVAI